MPHYFKPGRRHFHRTDKHNKGIQNMWETINVFVYLVGGIMFVIGSIFFLPAYKEHVNIGSWLFVVGSILYLVMALHDLTEGLHNPMEDPAKWLNLGACLTFIAGAIAFIFGSVFFLPNVGMEDAGAYCFIIGSILFVAGALINALQIFQAIH